MTEKQIGLVPILVGLNKKNEVEVPLSIIEMAPEGSASKMLADVYTKVQKALTKSTDALVFVVDGIWPGGPVENIMSFKIIPSVAEGADIESKKIPITDEEFYGKYIYRVEGATHKLYKNKLFKGKDVAEHMESNVHKAILW